MDTYSPQVAKMIDKFRALPGLGNKKARTLAFAIATMPDEDARSFANAIIELRDKNHRCPMCQNLTDKDICNICAAPNRDKSKILVVEQPQDIVSFEQSKSYDGLYHILYGALNPNKRISINDITIKELIERAKEDVVKEIIVATSATFDGEKTAETISKLFVGTGISITRIGYGVTVGAEINNVDMDTLTRSLNNRTIID